jgi:broad specificity phosphatase PhoE
MAYDRGDAVIGAMDVNEARDRRAQALTVVFVRHAEAADHDAAEALGPALSPVGREQAEALARRLAGVRFSHVYSSNLARAYDTTQVILKYHDDTACTVTRDLREVTHYHFHPVRGFLRGSLRRCLKEEHAAMARFAREIREAHRPGEWILVVCHGNLIRSILAILCGRKPKQILPMNLENTSVTVLELWPSGESVLKLANCVRHLQSAHPP